MKSPSERAKHDDREAKDMTSMQPNKARADLWMDLGLVAFLVAFDVAARLDRKSVV